MEFSHVPVLLHESVQGLAIQPNGIYVDCTLGGGGHSREILQRLNSGLLIAIDQDGDAIENARGLQKDYNDKLLLIRGNFASINQHLQAVDVDCVDGFLLDLGVSSYQLDEGERGFSYMKEAELDMRMDDRNSTTAYKVVNHYSEKQLADILYLYGEERYARRIAAAIVKRRNGKPVETTLELSGIVKAAMPKQAKREDQHPARRTFQAIRIEVNNELAILDNSLRDMTSHLRPGGRICVITFHSLEDRIIKNTFKDLENPCNCPRDFPVCVCGKEQQLHVVTKKPVTPSEAETSNNPRARSAKLRIAERR